MKRLSFLFLLVLTACGDSPSPSPEPVPAGLCYVCHTYQAQCDTGLCIEVATELCTLWNGGTCLTNGATCQTDCEGSATTN